MTEQEFIDKINLQYQKAGELMEGKGEYNIYRGTAHPVSGYMEDVFALYMATRIGNKGLQFLVDKLISYREAKGRKAVTFKPDLAILDKSVLTHYYDLKTNLGWNRDLEKYLREKNELIQKIKGQKGWISFPRADKNIPEPPQNIGYAENLTYHMVVFNGWNIHPEQLAKNIALANALENVEMSILNTWNTEKNALQINRKAFGDLYNNQHLNC